MSRRVLLINDYAGSLGGAEGYTRALRRMLEDTGYETVEISGTPKAGFGSLIGRWFSPTFYLQAARTIRAFRPDIVHVQNCSRNVSPSPILAARRARVPIVMTVHDAHLVCPKTWMIYADGKPCPYGFGYRCLTSNCHTERMGLSATPYHSLKFGKVWLHRQILRACVDTFISPSRWLGRWIGESLGAKSVVHVPNFAPRRRTATVRGAGRDSSRLLFAGRLVREKGADLLISALALLPPSVNLDVAGDGPQREELERQCRDVGVASRITFHGDLSQEDLHSLYARSAALIVPSRWMENSPLVIFEALAAGLPVIGARRAGIEELVRHGETGLLFAPDRPASLALSIRELLADENRRAEMSRASELWSNTEFSPERHLQRLTATYEELCGANQAASSRRSAILGARE